METKFNFKLRVDHLLFTSPTEKKDNETRPDF